MDYDSFSKHEVESFKPRRDTVRTEIGSLVQMENCAYKIVEVIDFNSVMGIDLNTGKSKILRLGDLRAIEEQVPDFVELNDIADDDWNVAQKRLAAIRPLAGKHTIGRQEAEARAKELNIDTATLYRWLKKYNATESVLSLIPRKRGWQKGARRIDAAAEKVIAQVIEEFYLTKQRPSVKHAITEVNRRCYESGINAPSHSTIRARIGEIPEKDRLRNRGHAEKAKNLYTPVPNHFPNANYPLSVIQIDHTPVDIILVDDKHRLPIGRPWITLAIDVYTRVVTGFYVSFDPPSETSVAMCVATSILPKEEWLLANNVEASWPVWGIPKTIHVDNGADFRSNSFKRSCYAYGIHLEYRPVRQPRFGGHIERLLGTFLREVHALPGTTFASVKDRDGYDSEKEAVMTLCEFEVWLMTLITKVYHQKLHSSIGVTPLKQWEVGIFGDSIELGIGVPSRPSDRLLVLIDFLPSFFRTVQAFGVTIDGLRYYAEALRPWINSTDKSDNSKKKLLFRRDPRDLSSIWFYDPDLKEYFKVPLADQSLPTMSVWEYAQAKKLLKQKGQESYSESAILNAITELREQVSQSTAKSKKARRQAQRQKEHRKPMEDKLPSMKTASENNDVRVKTHNDPMLGDLLTDDDIDTFGDIA